MNRLRQRASWAPAVALALTFALGFSTLGCGKIIRKLTGKAIEEGTGVSVDDDGKTVSVHGKNGSGEMTVGDSAKIPDDWPKSVPIYPGAKVMTSLSVKQGDGPAYMVTLQTPDSPDKVAAYYKSKLGTGSATMDMNTNGSHMLAYEDKAAHSSTSIIATPGADGTTVQITTGTKTN